MSIGNCFYCGQYGGHTATCEGVAKQKQREELRELRAALQERDAKHLAGLEAIAMHVEALESKVAAQRVVLEQALEFAKLIAEHYPTISKPIITAIQGQLK